ncbi:ribokinase [Candidatus Pelagibacter sp.]|jgi:ribokinase|nr:ribokinase [Candidatus Pelagibacter sp.]MDB4812092.1 ribokinase [Candidatus Pelagibacter sp.]MDC0465585.1 ribokinase [Candidatus Pelagibacter sp.]
MNSICIFGVFVADLCFFANKIPVKGETVLGNNYIVGPGGKGSNQAIAAARLNGEVNFITKVGKDSHADMAFSLYKNAGVNVDCIIQDLNLSTGVAGIMIDENGNNAINVFAGAAAHLQNEDIDKNIEVMKKSKIFLTQMETPDLTTVYALKKAKDNDCLTILNPAPARKINENDFQLLDFFTPNETEAEYYLNKKIETNTDIKNAAKEFLNRGVKNIIITLGEKGIYFANQNEEYFVDALKLKDEVVDTTGAGDAFNGAFAVALANEFKYKDALIFANKVAGISTTRLGAASSMPFLTEVEGY